jgi:hypothetical protein
MYNFYEFLKFLFNYDLFHLFFILYEYNKLNSKIKYFFNFNKILTKYKYL